MGKCRVCGKYVDDYEWPQDSLADFKPDLCYECFLTEKENEEIEDAETKDFDINTEYGMTEVHPDPEDDDTPDLGIDSNQTPETEDTENDNGQEVSKEEQSIRDLQKLLFG